jgi:4-hydroxybenzoate polyprenyltransferase
MPAPGPAASPSWRAYLELVRPPNVATALADVLAGFAIAHVSNWRALPWLLVSTACLYAGGIVLNDLFDRDIDARERPERALPSGRVSIAGARGLACGLLAVGVLAAALAGATASAVAVVIVALVLAYDGWSKHHPVLGPLNMGLCRGANLALGAAVAGPPGLLMAAPPAALVTAYIVAVTIISRGEVLGGARQTATVATGLVLAVLGGLGALSWQSTDPVAALGGLALTAVLAWRVLPAFWAARVTPGPGPIRRAVTAGVLSLALADAVIAASYAGMIYSLALVATAFLAGRLARAFAVT